MGKPWTGPWAQVRVAGLNISLFTVTWPCPSSPDMVMTIPLPISARVGYQRA